MKHSTLIVKVFALVIILFVLLGLSTPYLAFAQDDSTPTPTPTEILPTPTGAPLTPTETQFAPTETQPVPTETQPTPTETQPAPTETEGTPPTPTPTEVPPGSEPPLRLLAVTPTPALGCNGDTCVFQVNSGSDDAGTDPVTCYFYPNQNEIYFGRCTYSGSLITSGFRFTNITIPQGTKIAQAYLQFTVDGPYSNPLTVQFFGDAANNSGTFGYYSQPASRLPLTTASAIWDIPASDQWILGQTRLSPDLTQIVQEILDRPAWVSGNALSLIVKTTAVAGNSHRRVIGYERPIWYPGREYATRLVIKLAGESFSINKVAVIDNIGTPLSWDALVEDTLTVEARGVGSNPPDTVTVKVSALKSGKVTSLTLSKVSTLPDGTHIYRGSRAASDLVNRTSELSVAAVVYEQVAVDYQVAERFMSDLGVPDARRMGIAWGNGDQSQNRPPANLDYFRAAGYEPAQVEVVGYPGVTPGKFFVQNQASVLVYIGHGWHDTKHLCVAPGTTSRDCTEARPSKIGNSWAEGLQTVVQLGCSVLDINDMNGWWKNTISPGKEWVALTGPQTWLGFQAKAPAIGTEDHGENALSSLASELVAGKGWVESWRKATSGEIASPKFVGAVSNEYCTYHYWKEWKDSCFPKIGCFKYTWEATNSCADWFASSQGLEGFMASPATMNIYDPQERHVGPNAQGGIDTEIPGSAYWTPIVAGEPEADDRRVSIRPTDLSQGYRLKLIGTGEGTFTFNLEIPDRLSAKLYQVIYASVPVSSGAVFTLTLARGTDFALAADANGDGVFEGQVMPSDISTRALDLPVSLTLNGTAGKNGWYVSDVTATLSASTRPDLPSISSLEYDLGNGWQPYQAPLTISQENVTALDYRGTFSNGNLDATQRVNVQVDKTPPVITLVQPSVTAPALCSTFSIEYEAQDVTSGLDSVTASFDGEVITNGQTFDAIFLAPGSHEIVVTARDKAGLVTTKTYTIKVEAAIEDLICAKHRLYDMGQIYGPGAQGIVNSLDAKLEAAQRAQARGQNLVAVNKLNAFIQEVEAQTGKHITSQAAAVLIRAAQYIITNLTR